MTTSAPPLISVVIPVFNRPWELRRALDSLAGQTVSSFEVIVCDDGSSEDVRPVVASFEERLPLKFCRIDNSGGPARPRNVAIGLSQGEWISFLDSDDWWDEDRMAKVGKVLDASIDLLYHPLRLVGPGGPVRRGTRSVVGSPVRGDALRHMALSGNPIPNSAAIVRRKLLDRIGGISQEPDLVAHEDFDAWLRLVEAGARLRFIDEPLGSYWIGDDAISAFSERQVRRQVFLFGRHVEHFAAFRDEAQSVQDYTLALMHEALGCVELAQAHMRRARTLPNWSLRARRVRKLMAWALRVTAGRAR